MVTMVAVTRSEDYLAANDGATRSSVLNEGFRSAFWACAVLVGIGAALVLLLLGRPRGVPQEQVELEPSPAPAGD